ncbi:retinal short-chain dehydrogenase/reductase [Cylindrobasidium torrendii FP15055 ss-10]|uniref:Short-chain dehydrogenase/reductase 3 n=1 Tax=Cylindrobasidium torrendii FP15055 ss-10 TaxID=1314674 RepID=A0A0D7BH55_9AGAR|nr:retinal short-chain dehydrogenase/reductase [Cylindrobasidium torrendii FP15055 ss-10]
MNTSNPDPAGILDGLDIDLVVKVLSRTVFSPFFVFFIPIFFYANGAHLDMPLIWGSALYWLAISLFWLIKRGSVLYRNQGNFYTPPRFDWGNQIVLITGGASGIGELLANTLAVRNVPVVVLDIKPIQTENYNIKYYQCDVSKWSEIERVAKQVQEEVGNPTVLVNNAGVVQGKLILDLSPRDIEQTFGVNLCSHFWTLKAFLPAMIKAGSGHVITMSSIMGYAGIVRMSDYNASKAALINLNETLRYELDNVYNAPGVRTTLVCPGHVLTPLFQHVKMAPSVFRKFVLPDVAPVTVVKKVIQALDDQHSLYILVPFYANLMPFLQILPSFVRDFLSWFTDAHHSMDHFRKVTGLRDDEDVSQNVK